MVEMQMVRRRERVVKYLVVAGAFVLVAIAWYHGTRRSGDLVPVGSRRVMPELVMAQLDGGTWRMVDHRGQVVLINYWATWCGPCWEETPGLIRVARDFGPKGLAVVGVSLDEGGRGVVQKFVDEFKLPYPVAFPEPMSQLARGMEGVPTTILVDREGRVAKTYVGVVREEDFRADVGSLLVEKADADPAIAASR